LTSAAGGGSTFGWTYDANGNRLTQTGSSASTYTMSSINNQIASITGATGRRYSYDAAGNMLGYGATSVTYNNRARMITAANSSTGVSSPYVYNALGQLIETDLNTVGIRLFWYDEAGHYLGVYNGSGGLGDETVWLGDVPVGMLVPNGDSVNVYYVHTDHLNTPRQVTRSSDNTQMWTWFSDPFGTTAENQNPQGAGTLNYPPRLPGQLSTTEVAGLYQNGYRDYDPLVGRYIESDPSGLKSGVNTYAYSGGNSISNFDPTGLDCSSAGGVTLCAAPGGGPTIQFPTPPGFPASITSSETLYHNYDVAVPFNCIDPNDVQQVLINNPTPGNPAPATATGTPNLAIVNISYASLSNPVESYVTSDIYTGQTVVVNVTTGTSFWDLSPGYVARTVSNGVVHNYGEGLAWQQSPYLWGDAIENYFDQKVWGTQTRNILKRLPCRCQR
jgi:RHS repeat-associated protein